MSGARDHDRRTVSVPRISVGLPQYVPEESAPVVARYATRAEELGFAGLWTVDTVWFGAGAPPALRRAARLGDDWMSAGPSSSAAFVRAA